MKAAASEIEQLTKEVTRKRSPVKIDHDKLADRLMQNLDQTLEKRMNKMIDDSVKRMDGALLAQEARMEALGAQDLEKTLAVMEKATATLQQAEKTAKKVKTGMTWWGIGRLAMALLPFSMVLLALSLMIGSAAQVLGLVPLGEWIWEGFANSESVWIRLGFLGIFLLILAGAVWAVKVLGTKLFDAYKGWA